MIPNHINREILFYRVCKGLANDLEIEQIEQILADDDLDEFNGVKNVVDIQNRIEELESCDTKVAFRQLQHNIRRQKKRKSIPFYISRTAVILLTPLLLSTGIFACLLFRRPMKRDIVYTQITVPPGSMTSFELPDRSKVWLNAGSTLRYPNLTDTDICREVELEGEGYFEVHADPEHPFYVNTPDGIGIMAHGTKFGVRTGEHTIEAVLAEGSVSLFKEERLLAKLKAGEQATYKKISDELQIDTILLREKLAWKDGEIFFRNASLEDIFARLERQYNVDIVFNDPYFQSGRYSSRVKFKDETIEQIMTCLQAAAPIEWTIINPARNEDAALTRQRIEVTLNKKASDP